MQSNHVILGSQSHATFEPIKQRLPVNQVVTAKNSLCRGMISGAFNISPNALSLREVGVDHGNVRNVGVEARDLAVSKR